MDQDLRGFSARVELRPQPYIVFQFIIGYRGPMPQNPLPNIDIRLHRSILVLNPNCTQAACVFAAPIQWWNVASGGQITFYREIPLASVPTRSTLVGAQLLNFDLGTRSWVRLRDADRRNNSLRTTLIVP